MTRAGARDENYSIMETRGRPMAWILGLSLLIVILANLSLFAELIVHGRQLVGTLWGYSPNQFFFLLFIFPTATVSVLSSIYFLFFKARKQLANSENFLLNNLPVLVLTAVALACVVSIAAYFNANTRLDNLKGDIATKTLQSIDTANLALEKEDEGKQKEIIRQAKRDAAAKQPALLAARSSEASDSLMRLRTDTHIANRDFVFLYLVQDPKVRLKANLYDESVVWADMIALVAILSVAILGVFSIITLATISSEIGINTSISALSAANTSLFVSVICFSLYAVCIGQGISELNRVIDVQPALAEPYITAALCLILAIVLTLVSGQSTQGLGNLGALVRVGSFITPLFALGFVAKGADALRKVIGVDTNWGIQATLGIVALACFASFAMFYNIHVRK